ALAYLVAGPADGLDRLVLGIRQVPVDVPLAGDVGARVAAAHGHDDVGAPGELVREALWLAAGQVDAELAHDLDDLRMHPFARRRPCGCGGVAPGHGLLEHRP